MSTASTSTPENDEEIDFGVNEVQVSSSLVPTSKDEKEVVGSVKRD